MPQRPRNFPIAIETEQKSTTGRASANMENGSHIGVTTAETTTMEIVDQRQELKRRAGATICASCAFARWIWRA